MEKFCIKFKQNGNDIRYKIDKSQNNSIVFIREKSNDNSFFKRLKSSIKTLFNCKATNNSITTFDFQSDEELQRFIIELNRIYNQNCKHKISNSDKQIRIKITNKGIIEHMEDDINCVQMNQQIIKNGEESLRKNNQDIDYNTNFLTLGQCELSVDYALKCLKQIGYEITVANLHELWDNKIATVQEYQSFKKPQQFIYVLAKILNNDNTYEKIIANNKNEAENAEKIVQEIKSQRSGSASSIDLLL